jgi:hypothetical protein
MVKRLSGWARSVGNAPFRFSVAQMFMHRPTDLATSAGITKWALELESATHLLAKRV